MIGLNHSKEKNRVLLITDVTDIGGTDTFLIDVANAGRKMGWNISALINDTKGSDQLHQKLVSTGFEVIRSPLYHGYYDKHIRREATLQAIYHFKPDIIHVFCGSPRSAITPREIAIEKGIPLFFTEAFVPEQPNFAEGIHERVHKLYEQAAAVTTVCRNNIKVLSETYNLPHEKIIYIPSSVELDLTKKNIDRSGVSNVGVFRSVTAGRFVKQKGIDILIESINLLDDTARKKINFTIIGSGEEENLLKKKVDEYDLRNIITFVEWQEDLFAALDYYDVFIAPSRHEGGLPFTILIALSKGMPIIASHVSGIVEALDGGELGELFESENPVALAESIKRFIEQPSHLYEKAKKSQRYLQENYDLEQNMNKIIQLWDKEIC